MLLLVSEFPFKSDNVFTSVLQVVCGKMKRLFWSRIPFKNFLVK